MLSPRLDFGGLEIPQQNPKDRCAYKYHVFICLIPVRHETIHVQPNIHTPLACGKNSGKGGGELAIG